MKKIVCLIFVIACFSSYGQNNPSVSITIYGVSGEVETNVEKRLHELNESIPLSEIHCTELQEQVIQALQPFGYFKATAVVKKSAPQKLSVTIHPGPQTLIEKWNIKLIGEGAKNSKLRHRANKVTLKQGTPFITEQYEHTKLTLLELAEQFGYLHAHFKKSELLIDKEQNTANITFILDTGKRSYYGQIQFNPTSINPKLLHRFVPFHPGQIYSNNQIAQLNNALSNSEYFSSIMVKPQTTQSSTIPLQIHTEPVAKYSYALGTGYGTDTGPRGRAALHVVPLSPRGDKLNLMAQGSLTQNALQAQYVIPGKNPVADQYSLTGNFSNLNYPSGYSNSLLTSLAQQHQKTNYQRTLSLNALYEGFHYTKQQPATKFLLYPKATFSWNNTQQSLFSPSGYHATFQTFTANQSLLSSVSSTQAFLDLKAAKWIEPLALRLYGHMLQGLTAIKEMNQQPLSLSLLLGGTENLKAYPFNSLGPGRMMSYGGIELQKETKKNWYAIAFYDTGSIYNPSPKKNYYDAGAALMWVSPIGPIKIGLAQAINHRWQREEKGPRLVISLGPDL